MAKYDQNLNDKQAREIAACIEQFSTSQIGQASDKCRQYILTEQIGGCAHSK